MQEENVQNSNLEETNHLKIQERMAFLKKYNRTLTDLLIFLGKLMMGFSILLIFMFLFVFEGGDTSGTTVYIIIILTTVWLPGYLLYRKGATNRTHNLAARYMELIGDDDKYSLRNLAIATQTPEINVRFNWDNIIKLDILPRASIDETGKYIIFKDSRLHMYQINTNECKYETDSKIINDNPTATTGNRPIMETKFGKRTKFIQKYTEKEAKSNTKFGYVFLFLFIFAFINTLNGQLSPTEGKFGSISFEVIFLLIPAIVFFSKAANKKRHIRAANYMAICGENDAYPLENVSLATGIPLKTIKKDLKSIIENKILPYAKIDDEINYILFENVPLSDIKKEDTNQKNNENQKPINDAKSAVAEGREYIRLIKKANDDLDGQEISEKLQRLENVNESIFEYIEKNPERIPEIRKLMSYHLPVTMKLVKAFKEIDALPIQGDNIKATQNDILKALDVVNGAFESFLDGLFQNVSLDVASDIATLKTVLAQDGLLNQDDFKLKK